jgi:hypothetical protein
MKRRLSFSGHEKFTCKNFWLKKGFDFFSNPEKSSDENDVIELGVGKNMVTSIRHWVRAFGILDENSYAPTYLGETLFGENGKDIFLEDYGTLWLLHYSLIVTDKASVYNLVFNELRRERTDFTKEQLLNFIERKCKDYQSDAFNKVTVGNDIDVLIRNYYAQSSGRRSELEDDFSSILVELNLIKEHQQIINDEKKIWYKIEVDEKNDLPWQIVLYSILDRWPESTTISFSDLLNGNNAPALIFALTNEGLLLKVKEMVAYYKKQIIYDETAGNRIIQIKGLTPKDVLNDYYKN